MSHWDAIGYFASGMVFVAFGMQEMVALRIVAMLSNLAFIAYGLGLDLTPVWLLHAVLLPLNGWRLAQALQCAKRTGMTIAANAAASTARCIGFAKKPSAPRTLSKNRRVAAVRDRACRRILPNDTERVL